ncbi:MAG: hypothetical protein JWM67_112 [Mycobacterium sp.]|nr:hypothetical protein [Mycobacterium sp.]
MSTDPSAGDGDAVGGGEAAGDDGAAPHYTVASVARRLGIAPATLRTWDRRYGLGPGAHEAGQRRRYSEADVARLDHMRRLTHDGVAPAEAAAHARALDHPVARAERRGGGPGGRVLALPGASPQTRGLARAAIALDQPAVVSLVRSSVRAFGIVGAWDVVLVPVLQAVGARWAMTGEGVDVEHLLSEAIVGVLREAGGSGSEPRNGRPVLLAAVEDENHTLPLHALAAALAERGLAVRMLGAALPAPALLSALRRTGAAALVLWAQVPGHADAQVLERIPATRPPTAVFAGGPGWDAVPLPGRTRRLASLSEAVDAVWDTVA